MKSPLLIPLLLATVARADTVGDLRKALERYPGDQPFKATVNVKVQGSSNEKDTEGRSGSASFVIEDGPAGFTLGVSKKVLLDAEREAEAKKTNANQKSPTRTAMVGMTLFQFLEAADAGSMLLHDLDGATLAKESKTQREGKPARLIELKVRSTLAGAKTRFVKEPKIQLRVWVGADNLPIAAERTSTYGASILIVSVSNVRKETFTFATSGDRIYASRSDEENRASGVGRSFVSLRSAEVRPTNSQ